jgi:hypothetical protein
MQPRRSGGSLFCLILARCFRHHPAKLLFLLGTSVCECSCLNFTSCSLHCIPVIGDPKKPSSSSRSFLLWASCREYFFVYNPIDQAPVQDLWHCFMGTLQWPCFSLYAFNFLYISPLFVSLSLVFVYTPAKVQFVESAISAVIRTSSFLRLFESYTHCDSLLCSVDGTLEWPCSCGMPRAPCIRRPNSLHLPSERPFGLILAIVLVEIPSLF